MEASDCREQHWHHFEDCTMHFQLSHEDERRLMMVC
jgi:hypothetical protein